MGSSWKSSGESSNGTSSAGGAGAFYTGSASARTRSGTSSRWVATVYLFPRRTSTSDMCLLDRSRTFS